MAEGKMPRPSRRRPIITLLTDFGLDDPFVGIMKGVIYSINSQACVIDICHGLPSYDVHQAGFLLKTAYPFFPKGSIHVVVVDPGVGSARRPLIVWADDHYFIGPDNGVFSYLYATVKVELVVEITASQYFLHPVSATFHGRDLFAPVAAHFSRGVALGAFGKPITDYARFAVPRPEVQGVFLRGEVLYVDKFGNLITNISVEDLEAFRGGEGKGIVVSVGGLEIPGVSAFYAQVGEGELGALFGSSGHLEVFVHRGSAARVLKAGRGEAVWVRLA